MLPDRGANRHLLALTDVELAEAHWDGMISARWPRQVRGPRTCTSLGMSSSTKGSRAAGLAALDVRRAALGWTTSVDPQAPAHLRAVGADAFLAWVDGVDLLLPNEPELACLGGEEAALRAVDAIVVTEDARGARWVCRDASPVRVPAPHVEVVDSTGAGDAFNAGFLRAWLAGETTQSALEEGVAAGSAAVTRVGARPRRSR
jgi:sugar/nucleoside kinase (ribokinase family)